VPLIRLFEVQQRSLRVAVAVASQHAVFRLPQNSELALYRLTSLRRLQRDDVLREGYVNAVRSYIEKGYCRQIPTDEVSTNTTW